MIYGKAGDTLWFWIKPWRIACLEYRCHMLTLQQVPKCVPSPLSGRWSSNDPAAPHTVKILLFETKKPQKRQKSYQELYTAI